MSIPRIRQGTCRGSGLEWTTQLCDTLVRDVIPRTSWKSYSAIQGSTTTRPWSCMATQHWFCRVAFWQLSCRPSGCAHQDGGRKKNGSRSKDLSTDPPMLQENLQGERSTTPARVPSRIMDSLKGKKASLVDVRSPAEFTGEFWRLGLPETCQRGGHFRPPENALGETCKRRRHVKSPAGSSVV